MDVTYHMYVLVKNEKKDYFGGKGVCGRGIILLSRNNRLRVKELEKRWEREIVC